MDKNRCPLAHVHCAASKDASGFAGDTSGGFIFPGFHPAPDAMFAFAKILEMLALQETSIAQIRKSLPPPMLRMSQFAVRGKLRQGYARSNRGDGGAKCRSDRRH